MRRPHLVVAWAVGCLLGMTGCSPPLLDSEASPDVLPQAVGEQSVVRGTHRTIPGYDPTHRVGILYFVNHTPPTFTSNTTGTSVTVEKVLRGTNTFSQFYGGNPDNGYAVGYLYHHRPQAGFYCLYEKVTDPTYPADAVAHANNWQCPDPAGTAARHAQMLVEAGIDYVILDLSNNVALDAGTLLLALRPAEILFREWDKLRGQGLPTPQIAVWAPTPAGSTLWQRYLKLYNTYPDLALTHEAGGSEQGRKVFYYVDANDSRRPDAGILNSIHVNGGAYNVRPVPMWTHANADGSFGSTYRWAFMSPCTVNGRPVTSLVELADCNQPWTSGSAIGSSVTVGPSYQHEGGYPSLPFQSPGKLRGLTLKKQFQRAFSLRPTYLLVSGFNEHASGHWDSAYGHLPDLYASGLEYDPNGVKQFIDGYGAEFTRDVEPTDEYGTLYWDLTRSCINRYKSGTCNVVGGQDCCNQGHGFLNVFSIAERGSGSTYKHFVSVSRSEISPYLSSIYWRAVCNRFPGTNDFCVNTSEPEYWAGPFIAFSGGGTGRTAVYRCYNTNNGKHFLSINPQAECPAPAITGGGTPLFYVSATKNGETPRTLRRCYHKTYGSHFHAVGLRCPTGTEDAPPFGYVK